MNYLFQNKLDLKKKVGLVAVVELVVVSVVGLSFKSTIHSVSANQIQGFTKKMLFETFFLVLLGIAMADLPFGKEFNEFRICPNKKYLIIKKERFANIVNQ